MVPQPQPQSSTAPSQTHGPLFWHYHPTTRERLFQELVRAQRDADRIARKRRLERKRWRREHLYPRFLGAAFVVVLFVALLDWEAIL